MEELKDILKRVSVLKNDIENLSEELSDKNMELKYYIETVIPDLMMVAGISKITIDGEKVRLSRNHFVVLNDTEATMDWFSKQGIDIFKRDLIVHCPDEAFKKGVLDKIGECNTDYKAHFHWKTMSSQIEDLIEAGTHSFPECFTVTTVTKAFISEDK